MRNFKLAIILILAILSFNLADTEYDDLIQLFRLFLTFGFVVLAYFEKNKRENVLFFLWLFLAILFNPWFSVRLYAETWIIIDLITILIILISFLRESERTVAFFTEYRGRFFSFKRNKTAGNSIQEINRKIATRTKNLILLASIIVTSISCVLIYFSLNTLYHDVNKLQMKNYHSLKKNADNLLKIPTNSTQNHLLSEVRKVGSELSGEAQRIRIIDESEIENDVFKFSGIFLLTVLSSTTLLVILKAKWKNLDTKK